MNGETVNDNLAYKGVLVKNSTMQSILTATDTNLTFNTENHDTNNFFDIAKPSQFKIPSGVNKVRLYGCVEFATNATGYRTVYISQNGVSGFSLPCVRVMANTGENTVISLSSPVINVTENDVFTLSVKQNSGGNLNVVNWFTYFGLEVVK